MTQTKDQRGDALIIPIAYPNHPMSAHQREHLAVVRQHYARVRAVRVEANSTTQDDRLGAAAAHFRNALARLLAMAKAHGLKRNAIRIIIDATNAALADLDRKQKREGQGE